MRIAFRYRFFPRNSRSQKKSTSAWSPASDRFVMLMISHYGHLTSTPCCFVLAPGLRRTSTQQQQRSSSCCSPHVRRRAPPAFPHSPLLFLDPCKPIAKHHFRKKLLLYVVGDKMEVTRSWSLSLSGYPLPINPPLS